MFVMGDRPWLHRRYRSWTLALAMFCLFLVGSTPGARAADTSARSARLSYLQGNVTVNRVDNTGSDPAQINMPLAQGVRVATGEDGQAEIEFEDGSLVRLAPNSSLELTALTSSGDGNLQTKLTLGNGLAYAELRAASKFAYSVDAGRDVVSPVENATVRLDMDKPAPAIAVLDGTVQVERTASAGGEGYRTNVHAGETLAGDASDADRYTLTHQIAENSWDKWNSDRDEAAAQEAANQTAVRDKYAGEDGYGWSDLDANGSWYDVPGEGEVWQPNVAQDSSFDPYGYGSWVSYPGAGYVWASGYAWGWTPYRCGNWSYWGGFGWGWQPGFGCGVGGWGFGNGYGGGYAFNIINPPLGYRFRPFPGHDPGTVHPIRVGRPVINVGNLRPQGSRTIAGHTVEPLRPLPGAAGFVGGAHPGGVALRRDFPVDRISHQPVLGRGAAPEVVTPVPGVHPGVLRPVNPRAGYEGRESTARPMRSGPLPEQRQVRPQQEQQRPMAPPSAPHYSAPAQPRYSPPPQPHYAPPPSAPRSAPSAPAASHK